MKKYLFFDSAKCSACGACALACIDQNDVDVASGQQPSATPLPWRTNQGDPELPLRVLYALRRRALRDGRPCGCLTKDARDRLYPVRYHQLHRLPLLRHGLPLRRARLWPGRQDAQVRRLHRAPARRDAACLRQGLPHGRSGAADRRRVKARQAAGKRRKPV